MKSFLIVASIIAALSITSKCNAGNCKDYQVVLYKGDTVVINCDRVVVMDDETFAEYWHNSKQLKKLQEEVPEWNEVIERLQKEKQERIELTDSVISIKDSQIDIFKETQEELIADIISIEKENRKLIRKNKFITKITSVSVIINVILLLSLI